MTSTNVYQSHAVTYDSMRSVTAVILLATSVFGIPTSLIEDVKVAKMSPSIISPKADVFLPNKVKRAQEVFMYGNQQSQMPYSEINKFHRETRFPRNYKKEMSDMHYYNSAVDQRMKRAPMKRRSIPRIRSKRDSEIDPKDLLLLLALWEGKLGIRGKNRGAWNNYLTDLNEGDWNGDVDDGSLSDFDEPRNDEWMDGPVIPSVHQSDEIPSENHWDFNNNNRKRFMVSKRYQNRDEGGVPHYYNNQFWDNNVPIYRRMVL